MGAMAGVQGGRILSYAQWGIGLDPVTAGYGLDCNASVHASSFPTSSDSRLKANVEQIKGALASLLSLRGVRFDWDQAHGTQRSYPEGRHIGVIGQDVEAAFPEVVSEWLVQDDAGELTGETVSPSTTAG